MKKYISLFLIFFMASHILADDPFQEFKIKRKHIFEFTKKPEIKEESNQTIISFTVKDFCDVTVVIEDSEGKIIRHLGSGVLGSKAPMPFKKDSLEQIIIWDNKNDQGKYPLDGVSLKVRVSLGLQASYEKDLYHSPHVNFASPIMSAAPEGMYVYEGLGEIHIRLFDHDGNYSKTIYPFPASQLKKVIGLNWVKGPDGRERPEKEGGYGKSLLTASIAPQNFSDGDIAGGADLTCIAVKGNRVALVSQNLNRLSTDGSSGGLPLLGPKLGGVTISTNSGPQYIGPSSIAFSPDGKTVYMTGYMWQNHAFYGNSLPVVYKMNYETNDEVKVFAGVKMEDKLDVKDRNALNKNLEELRKVEGLGATLSLPTSLDTDENGNVYVTDFMSDRVLVFESTGKLLKSINVKKPAKILVHQKTKEIFVFSWGVVGISLEQSKTLDVDPGKLPKKCYSFTPYPEMKLKQEWDNFPMGNTDIGMSFSQGQLFQISLDSWKDTPTFWVVGRKYIPSEYDVGNSGLETVNRLKNNERGISIIQLKQGKWDQLVNFNEKVRKVLPRTKVAEQGSQMLYFNHQNEKLYVGERDGTREFGTLLEIDPITSKTKIIELPFKVRDIDFDLDGSIYLRTTTVVSRFELSTWREIAFDYGQDDAVKMGNKLPPLMSSIMVPAKLTASYAQDGMSVNANGDIAVACYYTPSKVIFQPSAGKPEEIGEPAYIPVPFPGRGDKNTVVHIWDKFGQLKSEDVVKGINGHDVNGIQIDKENNLYILTSPSRLIEGKPIDSGRTSTLIKFKNGANGRFLNKNGGTTPLTPENYPNRPLDISGKWVENSEWLFGGVGGFNAGCVCWYVRFKVDYFGRTFVPAPRYFEVAVLDSSGNLMLKIGQYGNNDSKGKNSKEPLGGDEVGLFNPCFVGVHTDRRLFIADIGNQNIMSVKLTYVVDEYLAIKIKN